MELVTKEAGMAVLVLNKINSKSKTFTRDKEGCYLIIKRQNHLEDTTIISMYAPNVKAPRYIKQIQVELKRCQQQYNNNDRFQYPVSVIDRTS
jgi:hypothetical protein